MAMKLLFCILFLSFFVVIFAYISRVLQNDIHEREAVYNVPSDLQNIPDGSFRNVFWIVQVTDIHISKFRGYDRAPDLIHFCNSHLAAIKPDLVIASGDLTDAKYRDLTRSKQFLEEWEKYHDVVTKCQRVVSTWLDLRGNHDAFDIPDQDHKRNLFRWYSSQGRQHPSSYVYHHTKPFGRYSFIAVDATPNPGPKRPFNFFGYIKRDNENAINRYLVESEQSNMTVAFGHYTTSLVATQSSNSVRHILRNVTAYLCGHLHTLAGLLPQLYARQNTGMLELELGDWRDARLYRVLAIDHDMLSISDQRMNSWPVIMVTNPKQASFISPKHEPLHRMANSSHIRILIFSPGDVHTVEVRIDDVYHGKAVHSEGPLFVIRWNPALYLSGVHTIQVDAQDSLNNRRVLIHEFSLDETAPLLPLSSRFVLKMDLASVAHFWFFFLLTVYVFVLVLLRNCNTIKLHFFASTQRVILRPVFEFYNRWLYRAWLVSKTGQLFYPLVGFILYIAVGPWFIGDILDGHTGVVFVWGMFVNGSYLPVCLTFIYGIFQIMTMNIPLTVYLGFLLQYSQISPTRRSLCHEARHVYVPFVAILFFQIYMAFSEFPKAYGTRALVLGPVRTGSIILCVVLHCIARRTKMATVLYGHPSH